MPLSYEDWLVLYRLAVDDCRDVSGFQKQMARQQIDSLMVHRSDAEAAELFDYWARSGESNTIIVTHEGICMAVTICCHYGYIQWKVPVDDEVVVINDCPVHIDRDENGAPLLKYGQYGIESPRWNSDEPIPEKVREAIKRTFTDAVSVQWWECGAGGRKVML